MKTSLLPIVTITALTTMTAGCTSLQHDETATRRLALEDSSRDDCLKPVIAGKPAEYRPGEWSLGVLRGESPLELEDAGAVENPVLTAVDVLDRRARFVADPFMLKSEDGWHLFFEVMNCGTEQGDIGYATSADGSTWTYQHIVLDEPFHLSYPHVFENQGEFWMTPESRQAGEIRLYAASHPSGPWQYRTTLVRGNYADPSIVYHEARWWIFAVEGGYSLSIFYADSLTGPWTKHPLSPMFIDDRSKTRPAGRMVRLNDRLVRFAQDNRQRYGHRVRAFEVTTLTPLTYAERDASSRFIVEPAGHGWREVGMHHVDAHQLADEKWIAVVDGTGYRARED